MCPLANQKQQSFPDLDRLNEELQIFCRALFSLGKTLQSIQIKYRKNFNGEGGKDKKEKRRSFEA